MNGSRPSLADCRLAVAFGLVSLVACATGGRKPDPLSRATAAGWQQLVEGKEAAWGDAMDAVALFGRATVAYERGQLAPALDDHLR